MKSKNKINNLVEICVILWLILLVGIGTVSAEGPTWTAKPGWDAPDDVGKGAAPAFVDIDDDGDYDLFIGEQYGVSFAYENTGSASSPIWTAKPGWNLPDLEMGAKPAFADLDNDGDYDVLIGEGPSGATYGYENTGSASSPDWTAKPSWDPPTLEWMGAKPALADLDNDGDYDLLLYQAYTGDPFAYENDGSVSSPNWTRKSSWDPPFAGQGATPDFADLDGDGDYDLLVGIKTDGATYAYENTGGASSPTWSRKPSWDPPNVTQLAAKPALADLDSDGDYDLLIGTMDGVTLGFENIAPTPTYTINGTTTPAADNVTIKNLNNSKEWQADVNATGFYNLTLTPGVDVNATEIIEIVADKALSGYYCPENYTYNTNVTRHEVVDIAGETVDLMLNHFRINFYPDYKYFTQDQSNYSGAAVMQMWTDFKGVSYDQEYLQTIGLANNTANDTLHGVPYIDPQGMAETMIGIVPLPPGHYFDARARDTFTHAMHETCWWQWTGPGAHPTDGYYAKWMSVRGIHTDKNPRGGDGYLGYNVSGLWVNDPNSAGIGANSYKTADEWNETYYKPINDPYNPEWDGKYLTLVEPPPAPDADVRIVPAKPRLAKAVIPTMMQKLLMVNGIKRLTIEMALKDEDSLRMVQAAIDGVTAELVPYDPAFATVFEKTVPGKPMLVSSDNGDYYIVPFNVPIEKRPIPFRKPVEIENVDGGMVKLITVVDGKAVITPIPIEPIRIKEERTLVVIIMDAADGSFKEASWVENPVKYLSVSKRESLKLVFKEMRQNRFRPRPVGRPVIELVHRDASPYYPDWKITIGQMVFFVSHDGTVSYDKPLPTPTLPPRPIKPRPIRILPI